MTAIGLPASANALANATAFGIVRSWSGFATPPGSTSPSYDATSALSTVSSTENVSALSRRLYACTFPDSGATSLGVPPACSTAFHGSVSSTCSIPSVATRNAIVLPLSVVSAIPSALPPSRRRKLTPWLGPVTGAARQVDELPVDAATALVRRGQHLSASRA